MPMLPAAPLSAADPSSATFSGNQEILALKRAKKLSYIRSNNNSGGTGADEEVLLSLANVVIKDEQEAEG